MLASLLVLISHYAWCFGFERLNFIQHYVAGSTGRIGVCLFFAISGYLVSYSIGKGEGLWGFYKAKLVRICLPYVTAYLFLSFLFLALSFLRPDFFNLTPFHRVFFVGGSYREFLIGLIPLDGYLNQFLLHWGGYWFVGEWFIGTLVSMYAISPILYGLVKRFPMMTFFALLAVSIGIYEQAESWWQHGFWFFLVRAPEFYIGILLHLYREKIAIHRSTLFWGTFALMTGAGIVDFIFYHHSLLADRFLPAEPRSFWFSIPMIIFLFGLCERVNLWRDISRFNQFSKISYTFMLIQHIVINTFFWQFKAENLSKLGALVGVFVVLAATIYLAKKITNLYKPVEEWLLRER